MWRSVLRRTGTSLDLTPEESEANAIVTFKGQVNFPSGTASAPSVRVGGSQTGLMEVGGSSLGLVASGMEKWRVGSGGSLVARHGFGRVLPFPGSAGVAAVATEGDPDTGLYWQSADVLSLTTGGTERVRVSGNGLDVSADTIRLRSFKTPASSSAIGNQGDICWDDDYVYVCVTTNTWKRSALATW